MLDPRHPEDTLFFVAESDYRFYPQDCLPGWYDIIQNEGTPWLDERLTVVVPPSLALAAPSPSPAEEHDEPSPAPAKKQKPKVPQKRYLGWSAAQRPEGKASEVEVSREVRDMVQICNRAAKNGRGHVVWFGWSPAGTRRSVPSYGSHLLACTKYGAQIMLESMEKGILKKGHWDIVLRNWLVEENFQNPKVMGASFVWPAVGYYQTHKSGCDPKLGDRVARWDQSFIQPGVRPMNKDQWDRWLACWPPENKGGAEYLEKIVFDSRKNVWITQSPPDRWWSTDADWQRLLWNRWWIGNDGEWLGPQSAADAKGAGKSSRALRLQQQSPAPANKWELLCKHPDEYEWDAGNYRYMPITRLAEQVVVDWDTWHWNSKHSNREWNSRKKAIAFYKRREFPISDAEEAIKTNQRIYY